jgi:hypothetical protein
MYSLSDSRSVSVANDAVDPAIVTDPGIIVVPFFSVIAADVTIAGSVSSLKLTATTGSTNALPDRSAGITDLIPAFNGSPIEESYDTLFVQPSNRTIINKRHIKTLIVPERYFAFPFTG